MKKIVRALSISFFTIQLFSQDRISLLPKELHYTILSHVYVNYNHPIEFTHIALVAEYWHSLIKDPSFINKCNEKGFSKPVLVFYSLDLSCSHDEIISSPLLSHNDLLAQNKESKQACDLIALNAKVWFQYKHPRSMTIDSKKKQIFYDRDYNEYIAMWVNPNHTLVYNQYFADCKINENSFYESCMSLKNYIVQDTAKRKMEKEKFPLVVYATPLTAVPYLPAPISIFSTNQSECTPYYEALVLCDSPLSPKKFVVKWPTTYQFKINGNIRKVFI